MKSLWFIRFWKSKKYRFSIKTWVKSASIEQCQHHEPQGTRWWQILQMIRTRTEMYEGKAWLDETHEKWRGKTWIWLGQSSQTWNMFVNARPIRALTKKAAVKILEIFIIYIKFWWSLFNSVHTCSKIRNENGFWECSKWYVSLAFVL